MDRVYFFRLKMNSFIFSLQASNERSEFTRTKIIGTALVCAIAVCLSLGCSWLCCYQFRSSVYTDVYCNSDGFILFICFWAMA